MPMLSHQRSGADRSCRALAEHLRRQGAVVGFLEWDLAHGKGIDDHLAAVGPEMVLAEISRVSFTSVRLAEGVDSSEADP